MDMHAHNFIDLTGRVFGRLTVISEAPRRHRKVPRWLCECSCGKAAVVEGKNLRHGLTVSCGCFAKEVTSLLTTSHGLTNSAEYKTWTGMKRRCLNKNDPSYDRYGGRGIRICDRWLTSFENFYADMGPRPSDGYSIERIDANRDYEPNNCKWIPMRDQAANKRSSVRLTHNGETHNLKEWSLITGMPYGTMQARHANGWDDERTITTPVRRKAISR